MRYVVNISGPSRARVHEESCPQTKDYPGNPQNPENWFGPFDTLREAEDYMHRHASGEEVKRADCCLRVPT